MMDAEAVLELWQFSLKYADLPFREDVENYADNAIYRSRNWPRFVFVYHKANDHWDCFVWKDY
jgi:hypothetical protein